MDHSQFRDDSHDASLMIIDLQYLVSRGYNKSIRNRAVTIRQDEDTEEWTVTVDYICKGEPAQEQFTDKTMQHALSDAISSFKIFGDRDRNDESEDDGEE